MIIHERRISISVDKNGKLIDLVEQDASQNQINGIPEHTQNSIVAFIADYQATVLIKSYAREIRFSGIKELIEVNKEEHFRFSSEIEPNSSFADITITNALDSKFKMVFTYEYRLTPTEQGEVVASLFDKDGDEILSLTVKSDFEYQYTED